jgi:hypothetical protein
MKFIAALQILIIILLNYSCDTTEPDDKRKLTLSVEDVSTTEVRLRLRTTEIQLPANISITKNSTLAKLITLKSNDSLFTVDSLQPSTSYSLQAIYDVVKSDPVTAVTMDTTTQNFTFETVEFGDGFSSSYFNDVWIFDENNIWAVGFVSSGVTAGQKNIVQWDGNVWKGRGRLFNSSGIDGIWAVDSSTIYFATGIVLKYSNGTFDWESFNHIPLPNGQAVEKLWGSSESNIWGVGPWGTIVHYDGNGWAKIEFDRQWYFYNITGNKKTGIAYAVARATGDVFIIAELKNNMAKILYTSGNTLPILNSYTIDYHKQKLYLAGGDYIGAKIWEYDLLTNEAKILKDLFDTARNMLIPQISVNNTNDIYFLGRDWESGKMIHYNGLRFTVFKDGLQESSNYGDIHSIENLTVAAGFANNKAYITKIRRN